MPYSEESLIFGDFTADEWEKYFCNTVSQTGSSRAVEFLFELEFSDTEEQDASFKADPRTQSLTSDIPESQNAPTGTCDSGVEVGQESEQESASGKAVHFSNNSINLVNDSAFDKKEEQEPLDGIIQTNTGHIHFGQKSIVEDHDKEKRRVKPSSSFTVLSQSDGVPCLALTFPGQHMEKTDNERSHKRRRRRRQRKRSGSVSSSSSECSEKDRITLNSPGLFPKNNAFGSVLSSEEVAVEVNASNLHANVFHSTQENNFCHKESSSPRHSVSSSDGKNRKSSSSTDETLNSSPVQSDTDISITDTYQSSEKQWDRDLQRSESQTSTSTNQEIVENKETPKLSSWADLFKCSSSKSSLSIAIKAHNTVVTAKPHFKKTEEDQLAQTVIGVEEDKYAKQLADSLQKQNFLYNQEAFIPRGLTNKGNWCYINATLQALTGCSPFINLLRQLPFHKDKGLTSTPIIDSMLNFVNEFKEIPIKQGNSSIKLKTDLTIGQPIEPLYVYKMLSTIQSSLSVKGRQEDAQEFLSCILNGMHEEMLQLAKVTSPSIIDKQIVEGSIDIANEGDWEQVGRKNKSVITRMGTYPQSFISSIFGGFLRYSVHQSGLRGTANVEPFFELHLDVQPVTSVEEALKNLVLKEEVQGYTCTKTNAQVDISRRVTIESLPKILILHLKRFIYSKFGSQKLQKVIDYPLMLTIDKELLSSSVQSKHSTSQKTYKLFAVVYHHGKNAGGGHYTCDVCHPVYGWIRTDDTRLKIVPPNYVLKPTQGKDPYLLLYRRADLMP